MAEPGPGETVRPYSYPEIRPAATGPAGRSLLDLGELPLRFSAIAGSRPLTVQEVAAWSPGQVVELDRSPTDSIDIEVNGRLIATGHVVLDDAVVSVRVSEIVTGPRRRRRG